MSDDLGHIFKPRSIAVVGASRDPNSFGHRVVRSLVEGGFQGPVYPVNARAKLLEEFEEIREFEINPLMALPRRKDLWAVDGMMRLFNSQEMKTRGAVP